MRLSPQISRSIKHIVAETAGPLAQVRVFGSRVDDQARGGDLDLLIELPSPPERPAWLAAQIAGRTSRLMHGRHVDVVLSAPGLQRQPIHDLAQREGVLL